MAAASDGASARGDRQRIAPARPSIHAHFTLEETP